MLFLYLHIILSIICAILLTSSTGSGMCAIDAISSKWYQYVGNEGIEQLIIGTPERNGNDTSLTTAIATAATFNVNDDRTQKYWSDI